MSELVEFLLARIAEDEALAQAAEVRRTTWATAADTAASVAGADAGVFILFNDPSRVLRECEAKRTALRLLDTIGGHYEPNAGRIARQIQCALALPYADHPDYREQWRP